MPDQGSIQLGHSPLLPPGAVWEAVLARDLITCETRASRMQGGQTNRVWRLSGGVSVDLVLKLYDPKAGNALFPNDPGAEARLLSAPEMHSLTPFYVAHGETDGHSWLIFRYVDGAPWQADPEIVAGLLNRLHTSPAQSALRHVPGGSANIIAQGRALLDAIAGQDLGRSLLDAVPQMQLGPASELCLIHGDPVPGNILCAEGAAVMIDWQCPAMGDPTEDLAIFLSPAMQQIYRGHPLSAAEETRFLAAYRDQAVVARYRALAPLFHWRMACYCASRLALGKRAYQKGLTLEAARLSLSDIGEL